MTKMKSHKNWLFPCLIIFVAFCIELFGNFGRTQFSYQNNFGQNNEYWRTVTGHLTHLGWSHFLLNSTGLILVWYLYGKAFRPRVWTFIFLWCSVSISLGFYFFDITLQSYVGLSGVLHGLIAAGLLRSFWSAFCLKNQPIPWEDALIFIGLWCKVAYEQIIGPVSLTQTISGGNIVVNSHFYGAISGSIVACILIYVGKITIKSNENSNLK